MVTYSDGRPLPGATIEVLGTEFVTQVVVKTKNDGTYQSRIAEQETNYRLLAYIETTYNDHSYVFPLEPQDGSETEFFGADGFTKDFMWKISGRGHWARASAEDNPTNFFGGWIDIYPYDPISDSTASSRLRPEPGDKLEFTLVPEGPLFDGSDGETLTMEIDFEEVGAFGRTNPLMDIPVGRYVISGRWIRASGDAQDLNITWRCSQVNNQACPDPGEMTPEAEILFLPNLDAVRPYQSSTIVSIELFVFTE